ncbi:hypothetical protein AX15_003044 [Amanita polypyramis BW_CC]|nr:hypothetical protein AX15_003044 [Amanita polypyramis BW_CC]
MAIPGPQPLSDDAVAKKLAEFDSVPLFMKSSSSEEIGDTALTALQSLVHDGTPDEVALNFKERGNDYFKGKRYREALGFYTQGIDAKPTDQELQEALLCNRAACNLQLKNYGSVLHDCSKVLTMRPRSSKAYYRSAFALLALERLEEALDCCNRCLSYESENQGVRDVKERIEKAKIEKDKREQKNQERARKEKETDQKLKIALKQRHLTLLTTPDEPSSLIGPTFDLEDPSGRTLVFPVSFLYPQYATSDLISQFAEDTPFTAHLSAMFPPNVPHPKWDVNREYIDTNLVMYAMTHRRRLLKVGKGMTLNDVFEASKANERSSDDGLELRNGCLAFVVLPKGETEKKWVEEYKQLR